MSRLHLKPSRGTQRRVTNLIKAADAYAFVGSMHPDERADVEDKFIDTRDRFLIFLADLERRAGVIK